MTTFLDGPAEGQHLQLKHSPEFLRVVCVVAPESGKKSQWDALDQLGDSPKPDETIYLYKLCALKGVVHLNMGRGRGGFYPIAEYRFVQPQPQQELLRGPIEWREFTESKDE